MKVNETLHQRIKGTLSGLQRMRNPWWSHWRTLADYYLPARYRYLMSPTEAQSAISQRNTNILDATGTMAARTLAAGLMNGITSPARQWFKLRIVGRDEDLNSRIRLWLDDCERRILKVFAESNFYNSMSTMYLDLAVFGTAAMFIFEDEEKTIHCQNPCLGEFYLMTDEKLRVCGIAQEFRYTAYQLVRAFGLENCSEGVKSAYKTGGASLLNEYAVIRLIEPNDDREGYLPGGFSHRQFIWEAGGVTGELLSQRGYNEFPAICPRWELSGNDAYGTSPGMDALGDVIQLQHETKAKGQGLDKMLRPPMLADVSLEHKPIAMLPNGITFVPRLGESSGMRPMYSVNPPLQDISNDVLQVRQRIQETFHNPLFNRVLNLQTVRSAREIEAIGSEQLVLLGPVLHRLDNEALDVSIERTFSVMSRNDMFLPPPPELQDSGAEIKIQYVSIFSAQQQAVSTAPTERLLQLVGNLVPIWPEAKLIPNIPELLHGYAEDIGTPARGINPLPQVKAKIAELNQAEAQQTGLEQAGQVAAGAKVLSETEVGAGQNALQRLLESA